MAMGRAMAYLEPMDVRTTQDCQRVADESSKGKCVQEKADEGRFFLHTLSVSVGR